MYQKNIISRDRVINLVHPYHLRQIFSESINDSTVRKLQFFSSGVSVLPRLAVSCKVFFSAEKAIEAKNNGEKVCLCKDHFVPSDTIVMGEIDAIISLNPAAIHVVTACLSYGVPAFLNLEKFHVRIEGDSLINSKGLTINEGDWITISSKNKKIFLGRAEYIPARLQRYLDGENLKLLPKEEVVFNNLSKGYSVYKNIVNELEFNEFDNLNDLSKYIRTDLKSEPVKAGKIMNSWFDTNIDNYVERILSSKPGMHKEQHDLYGLLSPDRRIGFFKQIIKACVKESLNCFTAGSFMLGRFLSISHPIQFWNAFNHDEIQFMLNEYVCYEKYLHILNEVGERKVNRAKDYILKHGINGIKLKFSEINSFITLKLSKPDWNKVGHNENQSINDQTQELIEYLSLPYNVLFDFDVPWSVNKLKKVCSAENVSMPFPEEI